MDSPLRSIVKAFTWQAMGLVTMTGLAFLLSGDIAMAGGFALSAAATGFVFFIVHERIWALIPWGRRGASQGETGT
jgi:uncharacterized membrane protein